MGQIEVVLCDVDGVFANFVDGALSAHKSPLTHDDIVEYDMAKLMGISDREFWVPIDAQGDDFWRELDPYRWHKVLYEALKARVPRVHFVTQPSWSHHAYAGKKQWFDEHFGRSFRELSLTKGKELMSKPGHVLIDDSPFNVKKFREVENGGEAILFPQPWNCEKPPEDRVVFVLEELKKLM
jgi:hypothetical protein